MCVKMTHQAESQEAPTRRQLTRLPRMGLPFFTTVFAALLLANLTVIGVLIFRPLSRRVVTEALLRSREKAEDIARQLAQVEPAGPAVHPLPDQPGLVSGQAGNGPVDLACVVRTTTTLARYIEGVLQNYAVLQEIAIVNDTGAPVRVWYRRTDMERAESAADGLDAGPTPASRELVGPPSTVAEEVQGPVDGSESGRNRLERLGIPVPATRLPPGVPQNLVQVRRQQQVFPARDADYQVSVPVQLGARREGYVKVALSQNEITREIDGLRRDLMLKVAIGAAISLMLIVLAYLFVLKLLRGTRDLEAQKQASERLAYVGTLATELAHEIRNPLTAMKLNLQMVEQEVKEPPRSETARAEVGDMVRDVQREVNRLDNLVTQLLLFARPTRLDLQAASLNRVVEETVQFLHAEAEARGVATELALDPALPAVSLDETHTRQAILNLLRNAFEALEAGGGGKVRALTTRNGAGSVRLVIEDDGPGIPEDRIGRIFDAFYSSKPGGTGLGLAVVRKIIEAHGGDIDVESHPGSGTRFILHLPLAGTPEPELT
jgi:signal transduction histidine kinase